MLPWYSPNLGVAYDHDLQLIWNFWNNIPDANGHKFYMTDHSYSLQSSGNMVGGDQFAMALSSWSLYYAYTGDTAVLNNMIYIANTYLANSISNSADAWPNIPFPCNYSNPTLPVYDGDYILGANFTQPDKAGSFGAELLTLYKITRNNNYLQAAINIANTLAANVQPGDSLHSPYPFKVNAENGTTTSLISGDLYTSDFVPTMRLFEGLSNMGAANAQQYDSAYKVIKTWVQTYPQNDNEWGCFFEDIFGPSNTETNAVTMAWYILQHPGWSPSWQQDARSILDWTFATFEDTAWNQYGATAIFEQSVDLKPGGSHTSRYASTELLYSKVTGDTTRVAEALRELNWATYLVDTSGQCRFSPSESSVWYTDGYGDYVRHFLRAMAYYPAIAPDSANHLLGTSSVITSINYQPQEIHYTTFDDSAIETLRLISKPLQVTANGQPLNELSTLNGEGWVWTPYSSGGAMQIQHNAADSIVISWYPAGIATLPQNTVSLQLFPNPASGPVKLDFNMEQGQMVTAELCDISGRIIKQFNFNAVSGNNSIDLNVEDQQPGVYLVSLKTLSGLSTGKLTVIH
jgi:hypothetical protein